MMAKAYLTTDRLNNRMHPIALGIALAIGSYSTTAIAQDKDHTSHEQVQKQHHDAAEQARVDQEAERNAAPAIEVIQVTARHRVESMQSTPIAITAFNAEQMKDAKIEGLGDIAGRTPGFQMNAYTSSEPELFMRGIGSDIESAGAAAAIGMYVDGVYVSRGTASAMDLYDLQSVEVLRGPQGTLYGKNVVGGAINFITKKPQFDEAEGSGEVTMGNYGLWEAKGYVTGGLSDNLAGKIAYSGYMRDGYGENTYTGNEADSLDRNSTRAQLLYTPADDLEILFSAGHSQSKGVPRVKHIGYSAGRNAPFISDDPRKDENSIDGHENSQTDSLSMKIDWFTDVGTFTSITAYRDNEYDIYENAAAGLVDSSQVFDPWGDPADNTVGSDEELAALQPDDEWLSTKAEQSSQISQEFRLASGDGAFSWLGGLFFMQEDISRQEDVDYWFHTQWGTTAGNVANTTDNTTTSYAAFGQASYEFTDALTVTAGLRYSRDDKDFTAGASGRRFDNWDNMHEDLDGNRVDSYTVSTTDSWSEWTPSLNVDYQATRDMFFYYSLAKGYKSGGFNGEGMEKAVEAVMPFAPEIAWNNEIGFKTQSFENRFRLNGAIFYTEYTDMQNQVWVETGENTPDNLQTMNGSGVAKGVELEMIALLTESFSLNGSYGYLNSEFTDDFIVNEDENYKGNTMRRAPEHTFNIYANYEWEIESLGDASARINYQYQDEYFFDNSNDPLTQVDSEFSVDMVLTLKSFDDTWALQLWGKNLTDELNIGSTTVYAAWDDTVYNAYKPPRTYGVTFSYNF
ncbi:TonB-dependent receptor [Shewanella sp. UCD-KL12]|uniref:TonB-dependent receptor n=1 Tax=Shewanella sp. UCD-KL12 TaxID=1917163 RepID=UPI000970AB60|nr:TonB-dependent receptor [Shewanella sp. UCD-KL12]